MATTVTFSRIIKQGIFKPIISNLPSLSSSSSSSSSCIKCLKLQNSRSIIISQTSPRTSSIGTTGANRSFFSTQSISFGKKKKKNVKNVDSQNKSDITEKEGEEEGSENFNCKKIEQEMTLAVDKLRKSINLIVNRVGRLTTSYLDSVFVLHLGQRERIDSVAQVIVLDPTNLSVIPYDPSYTKSIEQALYSSNLNLAPKLQSDGSLHISIPRLTVEVRQGLAKESGQLCEQARSNLRNIRQSGQKLSKLDLDSNLITKDDFKSNQKNLDSVSKSYSKLIDAIESKSKSVLLDK